MPNITEFRLCAICNVELLERSDSNIIYCPCCGEEDTLENVLAELHEFLLFSAAKQLQVSFSNKLKNDTFLQFKASPLLEKKYRFIIVTR